MTSKLESHASGASIVVYIMRYVSTAKRGAGGRARVRVPICGFQQHPRLTETRGCKRARHLRYLYTIYITHNIYADTVRRHKNNVCTSYTHTHTHIYAHSCTDKCAYYMYTRRTRTALQSRTRRVEAVHSRLSAVVDVIQRVLTRTREYYYMRVYSTYMCT